jgi:hypothetical protein
VEAEEAEEVEAEEVEAEEVEAEEVEEEGKQTPQYPTSDSAEIPPKYSLEKERKR